MLSTPTSGSPDAGLSVTSDEGNGMVNVNEGHGVVIERFGEEEIDELELVDASDWRDARSRLLVTPIEAARMLSISRSKLYEYLYAGRIRSLKLGGSRRIRVQDLEAFVEDLVLESGESPG